MRESIEPPLSLYVHLPWCISKCPYCDFNSHTAGNSAPKERYLKAVKIDLKLEAQRAAGRSLMSVFIGGGTPNFFSNSEIEQLVDLIAGEFSLQPDIEITMEVNPGTVEHGCMRNYATAGVNRLSLGAQSFNVESLRKLGRIHGPNEIYSSYEKAMAAGFDSINLDIMFALPGQNIDMAFRDVEQLVALEPAHISYYQLTLEPNTVFHNNPPADIPNGEESFIIQQQCHALMAANGYEQYEISAFAKFGFRCRHNLNYWTFGDYLAAGAGAHGKFTDNEGKIWRYTKPRHPLSYIEQVERRCIDNMEREVPIADIGFEFMLNALRLPEGFTASDYISRTGLSLDPLREGLELAQAKGMIEPIDRSGWRPTAFGLRFLNDLTAIFLV